MHGHLSCRIVLPDQVRSAVPIEIGRSSDTPACTVAAAQPFPSLVDSSARSAVVVDGDLPGDVVLPDQIGDAVAVEIGGYHDAPPRVDAAIQPIPALVG